MRNGVTNMDSQTRRGERTCASSGRKYVAIVASAAAAGRSAQRDLHDLAVSLATHRHRRGALEP
jgi:hypothetical protein